MSAYRRAADMTSPTQANFAALVCFAISGIMSMTFFRDDWGDRGMVMIGLMGLGIAAGCLLILKGRRLARMRSLFESVTLETPRPELRPGEPVKVVLGLQPARDLAVTRVVFRLEQFESSHLEAEHMNAPSAVVFQHQVEVKLGRELTAGKEHTVQGKLEVPAEAPATLALQHHQVSCRLVARIEGDEFGGVEVSWPLPVVSRVAPGASPAPVPALETRFELENLTLWLEGTEGARVGGALPGELRVHAEKARAHQGIEAALVWSAEGGSPESFEVDRVILAEPGELGAGDTAFLLGLEVPPDAPASYLGELVAVRWSVQVCAPPLVPAGAPAVLPLAVGPGEDPS